MSETPSWKRLEPASLLVNLIPDLWRTLRGAWPILLAAVVGGSIQGAINVGLLAMFFLLAVSRTIVHYIRVQYRMNGGRLEIRSGLFGRQHRVIDPVRIQHIAVVQNVFHKLAGLVELRVEPAGDGGAEGLLSALSVEEANALRDALVGARPEVAPVAELLARVGLLEVVGYGVSAARPAAAFALAVVASQVLRDFTSGRPEVPGMTSFASLGKGEPLVGWVLVGLGLVYVSSVGNAVLRYFRFDVVRGDGGIATESGLFTRRRVEVRPRKVQAIRLEAPLLRRWMGYSSLHIETAGSALPGTTKEGDAMIPMVAEDEVDALLVSVLPSAPTDLLRRTLLSAAPRVLVRRWIGATLFWGAVTVALVVSGYGWWGGIGLVWGWLSGWLDWRRQGWCVEGGMLVCRRGFLRRTTWVVPLEKIQSVHRVQGLLMRRHHLARVVVWVAGSRVLVPDLREADADALFRTLVDEVAVSGR